MKSVVIITGPGFEDSEFIYPFYRLQEEGFAVSVVTTSGFGSVPAFDGVVGAVSTSGGLPCRGILIVAI